MGKQSKTKQNRKKHNDGSYYLDLDCESAFDFRCKLADMQLQMIHKNQLNELHEYLVLTAPTSILYCAQFLISLSQLIAQPWRHCDKAAWMLLLFKLRVNDSMLEQYVGFSSSCEAVKIVARIG